jgi:predicted house-cleaning NTP pyrophosphatase (Maf/HAM1 superfamily)
MGFQIALGLIIAALIVCDTWVFLNGYSSLLHKAKTPEEKAIQSKLLKGADCQCHAKKEDS